MTKTDGRRSGTSCVRARGRPAKSDARARENDVPLLYPSALRRDPVEHARVHNPRLSTLLLFICAPLGRSPVRSNIIIIIHQRSFCSRERAPLRATVFTSRIFIFAPPSKARRQRIRVCFSSFPSRTATHPLFVFRPLLRRANTRVRYYYHYLYTYIYIYIYAQTELPKAKRATKNWFPFKKLFRRGAAVII